MALHVLYKIFFQFLAWACCAGYLALSAGALAQAPILDAASTTPDAMQECYLAADKINKLRPNWLATSYGECRSANQCNIQKCQSEILRKQEYVVRVAKEKEEQDKAQKNVSDKMAALQEVLIEWRWWSSLFHFSFPRSHCST